jgi:hypothetical protein
MNKPTSKTKPGSQVSDLYGVSDHRRFAPSDTVLMSLARTLSIEPDWMHWRAFDNAGLREIACLAVGKIDPRDEGEKFWRTADPDSPEGRAFNLLVSASRSLWGRQKDRPVDTRRYPIVTAFRYLRSKGIELCEQARAWVEEKPDPWEAVETQIKVKAAHLHAKHGWRTSEIVEYMLKGDRSQLRREDGKTASRSRIKRCVSAGLPIQARKGGAPKGKPHKPPIHRASRL